MSIIITSNEGTIVVHEPGVASSDAPPADRIANVIIDSAGKLSSTPIPDDCGVPMLRIVVSRKTMQAMQGMNPFPVTRPIVGGQRAGRNAPCPCGSGRKFKRCCVAPPLPAQASPSPTPSTEATTQ